jgi:hypothetical protein
MSLSIIPQKFDTRFDHPLPFTVEDVIIESMSRREESFVLPIDLLDTEGILVRPRF